jgi:hypothetical protein
MEQEKNEAEVEESQPSVDETQTEQSPPQLTDQPDTSPEQKADEKKPSSKKGLILMVVGIIVVLAIFAGYYFWSQTNAEQASVEGEVLGQEEGPVALVNGEEVPRADYNLRYLLLSNTVQARGQDPSSPEIAGLIQQQVLTEVVNTKLLLQAAATAGVSVSSESIELEYDTAASGSGGREAFESQLAAVGITPAQVMKDIEDRIIIRQYVDTQGNVADYTPTDEEIDEFYTLLSEQDETIPPLEQIKEQLAFELTNQKLTEEVDRLLVTLREQADIEILL